MNCKNCKKQGCSLAGKNHEMSFECKAYIGKTNADRIRSMTDEELADYLIRDVEAEAVRRSGRHLTAGEIDMAVNDCVSWLKSPVKQEGEGDV